MSRRTSPEPRGAISLDSVRVLDDAAGDRDDRRRDGDLRLRRAHARHVPRRLHRHRRRRARPPASRASRSCPPTRRRSSRPRRSSRSCIRRRTPRSTCSRPCRTPPAACCCSATRRPTPTPAPACRWTPSARTSCGCRARRRPARRAGSAPSRYIVSDGTDDAARASRARRPSTCCRPAPELAPIAVDDTVVVRAGAQIDIPVLDNDVAPAGGRPDPEPGSVVSSTSATRSRSPRGDVLRYLAPDRAGRVHDRLLGVHDRALRRSPTPPPCASA